MSLILRFGVPALALFLTVAAGPVYSQQPDKSQAPEPPPGEPAPLPEKVLRQTPPPPDPAILEDGGFSIEPIYWLNRAQPALRGGKTATEFGDLDYGGNAKPSIGGEIGIPAGHANTLRVSYFRVQGSATSTATQDSTLFSEGYDAGDFLQSNYLIQSAKISWDYLSYTLRKRGMNIRVKTLYEVQYTNVGTNVSAPFKAITTDAAGDTDTNTAHGTKNLILPTFGMGLSSSIGQHFRWEVKGSGFGLPHHGNIWDVQGLIAVRVGPIEIIGGEKAYHFKTSPGGDEYFADTLSGAYAGVRYYWGGQSR
jgi:hypothetical protein